MADAWAAARSGANGMKQRLGLLLLTLTAAAVVALAVMASSFGQARAQSFVGEEPVYLNSGLLTATPASAVETTLPIPLPACAGTLIVTRFNVGSNSDDYTAPKLMIASRLEYSEDEGTEWEILGHHIYRPGQQFQTEQRVANWRVPPGEGVRLYVRVVNEETDPLSAPVSGRGNATVYFRCE